MYYSYILFPLSIKHGFILHVVFRGTIKVDDLFYFLRHKNQFLKKPPNRKFYKEALEEIEADIEKDGGTDGDNSQNDTLDNSVCV